MSPFLAVARPSMILSEFAKQAIILTEFLEQNPPLDIVDQIHIENHLQILRIGYGAWKRRASSPLGQSRRERASCQETSD